MKPGAPLADESTLRAATKELCFLLDHGYARRAAGVLVGDRHRLHTPDRRAVSSCACTEHQAADRKARQLDVSAPTEIWVDGYNVLTSLQVISAAGVLLLGRDGCTRDMAGLHGKWRKSAPTEPALALLGFAKAPLNWFFDGPVSGSARVCATIVAFGQKHGLDWRAQAVPDPDPVLANTQHPIATADAAILDAGGPWVDLVSAALLQPAHPLGFEICRVPVGEHFVDDRQQRRLVLWQG